MQYILESKRMYITFGKIASYTCFPNHIVQQTFLYLLLQLRNIFNILEYEAILSHVGHRDYYFRDMA